LRSGKRGRARHYHSSLSRNSTRDRAALSDATDKLELLQKDDGTFSAGERSQTTRGIELAVKSIQSAAAKLL
jgi:hypothetical protein